MFSFAVLSANIRTLLLEFQWSLLANVVPWWSQTLIYVSHPLDLSYSGAIFSPSFGGASAHTRSYHCPPESSLMLLSRLSGITYVYRIFGIPQPLVSLHYYFRSSNGAFCRIPRPFAMWEFSYTSSHMPVSWFGCTAFHSIILNFHCCRYTVSVMLRSFYIQR